jgi:hypothetical protein
MLACEGVMRRGAALVVALVGLFQLGIAAGSPPERSSGEMAWDAFVVVGGILRADGTVWGCATPRARVMAGRCMVPGAIAEVVGMPEHMTPQGLLDKRIGGSLGDKRAVAVGVLPHWKSSGGKNPQPVVADGEFVIVYKVVQR